MGCALGPYALLQGETRWSKTFISVHERRPSHDGGQLNRKRRSSNHDEGIPNYEGEPLNREEWPTSHEEWPTNHEEGQLNHKGGPPNHEGGPLNRGA